MSKSTLKSIWAIFAGFIFVVIFSTLADFILIKTELMKQPFDQNTVGFIGFVIFYRSLFCIIGSYITAKVAPKNPMKHALIGGGIGLAFAIVGAILTWDKPPHWYAISLIITAFPCAWLGGKFYIGFK